MELENRSSTIEEAESAFKHKMLFYCKDNLNDKDTAEQYNIYTTHPAFLYFEGCMKGDLHNECLEWTRQLFAEFYKSYETIAKNIMFCLGFYMKWHPNAFTEEEKVVIRLMAIAALQRGSKRTTRFAAIHAVRHIIDNETLKLLGNAFNAEKDEFLKTVIKNAIQVLIGKLNSKEKKATIMNKVEFQPV